MDPVCSRCHAPGLHGGEGDACLAALRLAIAQWWQTYDRRRVGRRRAILRRFVIWGQMPIRRMPVRAITQCQITYPRRWAILLRAAGVLRSRWQNRRRLWTIRRAYGGLQFRRFEELGRPAGGRALNGVMAAAREKARAALAGEYTQTPCIP